MKSLAITKPKVKAVTNARDAARLDEDHALVLRARAGDRAAFSTLFERHHARIYAMCTRFLRDRSEVEDAVQQAFLEAWRCLERFEERSRFSTWLTRIAIHTCFGFKRKVKRLIFSDDTQDHISETTWKGAPTSLDVQVHERARREAVDEIVQKLSPKKRVVFVLAEIQGMTAPEISAILEVPDATVRTRLFHARKEFATAARKHKVFEALVEDSSETTSIGGAS